MATQPYLSPFVYWGQNKDQLTLNVELSDVESPSIDLGEENITFRANGQGQQGFKQYQFEINFYDSIDHKKSKYRVTAKNIEFQLKKQTRAVWPRLTYSNKKPQWLKVNFDQFAFDDDSSSSTDSEEDRKRRAEFVEREKQALQKRELNSLRQFYLFLYNFFMFFGYTYIFAYMVYQMYTVGNSSKSTTFENLGSQMMILQTIAVLEVLHPLFGAVKTGFLAPLMQFLGRGFVLFIVIYPQTDFYTRSAIWFLFGAWSLAEVLRYPYYMLRSYNREWGLVTWVRYTAWVLLYPMGFMAEGYVMLESMDHFDRTGQFSLELPNAVNMSFSFPAFLRLYMLVFLPASMFLMNHMYAQRKKKVMPGLWRKEQAKKKAKLAGANNKGPLIFSQKIERKEA